MEDANSVRDEKPVSMLTGIVRKWKAEGNSRVVTFEDGSGSESRQQVQAGRVNHECRVMHASVQSAHRMSVEPQPRKNSIRDANRVTAR